MILFSIFAILLIKLFVFLVSDITEEKNIHFQ